MTSLPSPIEPSTRLRHTIFTPRVPRFVMTTANADESESSVAAADAAEEQYIDPELLAILNDENYDINNAKNGAVNDRAATSSGKKPSAKRVRSAPRSKPEMTVENCFPLHEVVFQLQKMTGLRVKKDVEPALAEAVKQFNVFSIRYLFTVSF